MLRCSDVETLGAEGRGCANRRHSFAACPLGQTRRRSLHISSLLPRPDQLSMSGWRSRPSIGKRKRLRIDTDQSLASRIRLLMQAGSQPTALLPSNGKLKQQRRTLQAMPTFRLTGSRPLMPALCNGTLQRRTQRQHRAQLWRDAPRLSVKKFTFWNVPK